MLGVSQKFSKSASAQPSGAGEGRRPGAADPDRTAGGPRPDPEQLKRLLAGPEGQSLLRLLQADGGDALRAAAEALRRGSTEGVKAALTPLLAGTEAEALTRSLEAKL